MYMMWYYETYDALMISVTYIEWMINWRDDGRYDWHDDWHDYGRMIIIVWTLDMAENRLRLKLFTLKCSFYPIFKLNEYTSVAYHMKA